MDGVINIYKPAGISSFTCVSRVRRLTASERAGHAGTLDPQATGVLPVCLGKATRCADLFLDMPKRYRGEITFGIGTDTCDIWGKIEQILDPRDERLTAISRETLSEAVKTFLGDIVQIPPDYAAVKIGGVPAYKLARQGKKVEMRSRTVTIYEIGILDYWKGDEGYPKACIDVKCSRGTYIRSLFRDIGELLGVHACMSALERTAYGFMECSESVTLERLETEQTVPVYSIDFLLRDDPYIKLSEKEERLYRNGRRLWIEAPERRIRGAFSDGARVRLYTPAGRLLATASILLQSSSAAELKPDKFFDCGEVQHLE